MRPTEALNAAIAPHPTLMPAGFFHDPELSAEARVHELEVQRSGFFSPTGLLAFQQAMDAIRWRPRSDRVTYTVPVSAIAAGAHVRPRIMVAALLASGFRIERDGADAFTNLAVGRRAMARAA